MSSVIEFYADLLRRHKTKDPPNNDPSADPADVNISAADNEDEAVFLLSSLCQLYLDTASTGQ